MSPQPFFPSWLRGAGVTDPLQPVAGDNPAWGDVPRVLWGCHRVLFWGEAPHFWLRSGAR